jgi:serine/threonine protein kinase
MTTLNYLNSGTYGCVVSPGITSDNKIDTNINTVSKLFVYKENYKQELEIYEKIASFVNDDAKLQHLTAIKMGNSILTKKDKLRLLNQKIYDICYALNHSDDDSSDDDDDDDRHDSKSSHDNSNDPNIYQIEYFNGGVNLFDLFRVNNLNKKININLFLTNFLNVFSFINLINSNGYVHADIKLQNIIFDFSTHIFRLIDFGLTVPEDEIYYYENMDFLKEGNLYPPEYIFTANYAVKQDIDSYHYFFFNKDFIKLKDNIKSIDFKNIFVKFYNDILEKYKTNDDTILKIISLFSNVKTLENQEQIINYINNVCNTSDDTNINIKTKIDVYMLGTAFLYLLLHIFNTNINISNLDSNIISLLLELIFKMIQPNPCNRISMNEAFNEYQTIISQSSLIPLNKLHWHGIDFNMFFSNLSSIFDFYKTNTNNIQLKDISYNFYTNSFVFSISSNRIPKFNKINFNKFTQYNSILEKFKKDENMFEVLEGYKNNYSENYDDFKSNIDVNNVFLIGNILFSILLHFLQFNYFKFDSDKIDELIFLIDDMINPYKEKRISFDDAFNKYKELFL